MPAKRKRDILEGFDPNKSDSEDENFDPTEDQPRRSTKKSRSSRGRRKGGSVKRTNRYRGSDIEDDEAISDSDQEDSFGEEQEESEEEEDEDAPMNATGRRMRKAAVKHPSYKESSEDSESAAADSDGPEDAVKTPKKSPGRPSRIVVLKTGSVQKPQSQRPKRGKEEPAMPLTTRRATRARTEEAEEPLYELSNSGRHTRLARASKSKSPEAMSRATRATRATKGLKKPPAPTIEEATQESDPKVEPDDDVDELAGDGPEPVSEKAEEGQGDEDAEMQEADKPEEVANAGEDEDAPEEPTEVADPAAEDGDDDDDDDVPITRRTRAAGRTAAPASVAADEADATPENKGGGRRLTRKSGLRNRKKAPQEPSSDFEPGDESGGEGSASDKEGGINATTGGEDSASSTPVRGRASRSRGRGAKRTSRRRQDSGDEEVELDKDEMAEELEELRESSRSRPRRTTRRRSPSIQYEEPTTKKRRTAARVDYTIPRFDPNNFEIEEDEPAVTTPARGGRRGGKNGASQVWERTFNTTYGPFGGGGAGALIGGPWGTGATGGVDSDSSDDEMVQRSGVGGTVGMTPTSAAPPVGLFAPAAQTHNADGIGGIGGATPNVGKVKNQKAYADADPLGVDLSVDFSKVGGLQSHIDQLKEMVQLPLLYPELFMKFHVTPPRGVLFHGPPGTGKTLLARALANSVGSGGRKISFYMRKGADALSKWVGEAEKQLRLLFEEARRTQPSIIFFDEIDGLAPVRSSKQEQIHASIVSTLLALMDGMDGRGQVIVIGATNRPDNIDPALRRPGRFDREFYFPLPDIEARKSIIDIHTKDWGISDSFKNSLAESTKGYGGADLRALCTEAALNAIQRTYPQIYSSKEKLVVNPDKIQIHATDFMISIKKMIPSSERSTSSSAAPIPRTVEPLLRNQFKGVIELLDNILPRQKKITALQEALFEPYQDEDHGFARETANQEFALSRIFRPRLLISGIPGMGQGYLASAILHYLEGVHVQKFDLATLLGDGRPLEQVVVSLFTEVRRHKPSVIFIPNVDTWWHSLGDAALTTFVSMMTSMPANDPVLLLATSETLPDALPPDALTRLFPYSRKNRAVIDRPERERRIEFFESVLAHVAKYPTEFPDPFARKKRVLEELPVAPPPPPKTLTKEEVKAQRKADLHHLNLLKMRLQPIMDQIHRKYRKFRQPVIPLAQVAYLFNESDPNFVRPDLAEGEVRPFELSRDKEGTGGIREVATNKFYYNLETTTIEERLANGYYARPIDFYKDINRLYLDAKTIGDRDRTLKANELRTNVEVDVHDIAQTLANQGIRFDEIYERQLQRAREAEERARRKAAMQSVVDLIQSDLQGDGGDSDSQGPVGIGLPMTRQIPGTTAARFQVIASPPRSNGHVESDISRPLTNGTSQPSRPDEDVQMGGVDETQPHSGHQHPIMDSPTRWQGARLAARPLGDSTRATAGTQLSQRSALTSLPPGMSPSAVLNDASTTKTSDPSTNREWSTQQTNGVQSNADEHSQLVDTQPMSGPHSFPRSSDPSQNTPSQSGSSGRDWAHSQAAAMAQGILPPRTSAGALNVNTGQAAVGGLDSSPPSSQSQRKAANVTSLESILNDDTAGLNASPAVHASSGSGSGGNNTGTPSSKDTSNQSNSASGNTTSNSNNSKSINPPPPPSAGGRTIAGRLSGASSGTSSQQPILHEGQVTEFLNVMADRTSGCTIEQLEQIYRELMDEIWRSRGQWNRMAVLMSLTTVFNETVEDIEKTQGVLLGENREVQLEKEMAEREQEEEDGDRPEPDEDEDVPMMPSEGSQPQSQGQSQGQHSQSQSQSQSQGEGTGSGGSGSQSQGGGQSQGEKSALDNLPYVLLR